MKRLDALRPLFLKIGLFMSMFLVFLLFNFTLHESRSEHAKPQLLDSDTIEVIRTVQRKQEKRVPPPSNVQVTSNPVDSMTFEEPDTAEVIFPVSPDTLPMPEFPAAGTDDSLNMQPAPVAAMPKPPDTPLLIADKMPFFVDCRSGDPQEQKECSDKALLAYVAQHLKYPSLARENRMEGLVLVEFVVQKDGTIDDIHVLRDIGMGCAEATVEVVQDMPKWSPGIHHGRPVPVIFRLPVRFRLE